MSDLQNPIQQCLNVRRASPRGQSVGSHFAIKESSSSETEHRAFAIDNPPPRPRPLNRTLWALRVLALASEAVVLTADAMIFELGQATFWELHLG